MPSRYETTVDVDAPNDAHAFAVKLVGHNRRVLELGAASGHVTRVLADRHCQVTAIESDPEAAQDLHGVADRVIVGDLNDPLVFDDLPSDYEVILAGDVLEHLLDPDAVLRRAARLLATGGRVVVSVPNVAHADVRLALLQGRWRYRPWGLMDRTHIRFFTREGIEAMVQQAGLVITELQRVRMPAFETELEVDRLTLATEVVDQVLADPESETYQFVFAAVREGPDDTLRTLSHQKLGLEALLARAQIAQAAAEAEVAELRARVGLLPALEDDVQDLRNQREELIRDGEAARLRLHADAVARERRLGETTDALELLRRQYADEQDRHRTETEALHAELGTIRASVAGAKPPPTAARRLRRVLGRAARGVRRRIRS